MNTIKGGLKVYVDELKKYKDWTDEMKKTYGEDSSPMEFWDDRDYHKIIEWNEKITGMEEVLGLSKKEIEGYCVKVGIKPIKE